MATATAAEITALRLENGETIPTLDAFLEEFVRHPDLRLVLELKSLDSPEREAAAAAAVAERLRHYELVGRTDIIAFSFAACQAFVREMPGTRVYYLEGDRTPQELKAAGLAGLDYHSSRLDAHPEWIGQAHELGLEVNAWTIDDPETARRLARAGVDYLTTDCPEAIVGWLTAE